MGWEEGYQLIQCQGRREVMQTWNTCHNKLHVLVVVLWATRKQLSQNQGKSSCLGCGLGSEMCVVG